jgi:hypothetical protein
MQTVQYCSLVPCRQEAGFCCWLQAGKVGLVVVVMAGARALERFKNAYRFLTILGTPLLLDCTF